MPHSSVLSGSRGESKSPPRIGPSASLLAEKGRIRGAIPLDVIARVKRESAEIEGHRKESCEQFRLKCERSEKKRAQKFHSSRIKQVEGWRAASEGSPFGVNLLGTQERMDRIKKRMNDEYKFKKRQDELLDDMLGEPKHHICSRERISQVKDVQEQLALEYIRLKLSSLEIQKEMDTVKAMKLKAMHDINKKFPRVTGSIELEPLGSISGSNLKGLSFMSHNQNRVLVPSSSIAESDGFDEEGIGLQTDVHNRAPSNFNYGTNTNTGNDSDTLSEVFTQLSRSTGVGTESR